MTTLYTTARATFESWAALDAPHLPADPIDAMQVRLLRWASATGVASWWGPGFTIPCALRPSDLNRPGRLVEVSP